MSVLGSGFVGKSMYFLLHYRDNMYECKTSLVECLLCARHSAVCFSCILPFNVHTAHGKEVSYNGSNPGFSHSRAQVLIPLLATSAATCTLH